MKTYIKIIPVVLIVFLGGYFYFTHKASYTLQGKINVDSATIYLKGFKNKMFYTIDSAKVTNGTFSFKGNVKRPELFGLTIDRNETFSPYYIFIENSTIQVDIDTANTRSATITGSVSNDLFKTYKSKHEGFKIDSLIKANPKSPVAAYILYRNFTSGLSSKEIEADLALFDPSLSDLSYLKELKEIAAVKKKLENGSPAIDFSGTTPDGKTVKLSGYFGNYLLLDFWASWCPPCRKENPNLVKVYNKYKAKGFNIFSVSLDKERENWVAAIANDHLAWVHVSDLKFWDSAPAKLYAVRNIPSNFLIDPKGNIIGRNLEGEELDRTLGDLFK